MRKPNENIEYLQSNKYWKLYHWRKIRLNSPLSMAEKCVLESVLFTEARGKRFCVEYEAQNWGVSHDTINRALNSLVKKSIVYRVGARRTKDRKTLPTAHWHINSVTQFALDPSHAKSATTTEHNIDPRKANG